MSSETIVCRSTFWYHWRRIAMMVLVFGFCGWFVYDWQVGYPRKREAVVEWMKLRESMGKDAPEKDVDAAYAKLAAEKGLNEEVEKKHLDLNHWNWQINVEQPASAAIAGILGLVMLYFFIRTVRGRLTADADSFTTPAGQRVPFASAFRIDRRKWDHKGLAYVYYKDAGGAEKRAVIDDLVYGGAVQVLDRLQANFKGEIIDLAKEEPAEEEKKEDPASGSAGKDGDPAAAAAAANGQE